MFFSFYTVYNNELLYTGVDLAEKMFALTTVQSALKISTAIIS